MKYQVRSQIEDGQEVVEVTRTDPRVAAQDVEIITSILRRRAWVVEVQS
jgi:hypothetical protein